LTDYNIRTMEQILAERHAQMPLAGTEALIMQQAGKTVGATLNEIASTIAAIALAAATSPAAAAAAASQAAAAASQAAAASSASAASASQTAAATSATNASNSATAAATSASNAAATLAAAALKVNNLSDLASASAARTNLGLGALATKSAIASADVTDGSLVFGDIGNISGGVILGRQAGAAGTIQELTPAQARANAGLLWIPGGIVSIVNTSTSQIAIIPPTTAKIIKIRGHFQPGANNQQISLQITNDGGSTWVTTASYYFSNLLGNGTAASSASTGAVQTSAFLTPVGDTVVPNIFDVQIDRGTNNTLIASRAHTWWTAQGALAEALYTSMIGNVVWNGIRLINAQGGTIDNAYLEWEYC
jgi:hypothetical protein